MSSILILLIIQTATSYSACFLPNIITDSEGELTSAPTSDPTAAPTNSPTGSPTNGQQLEEWDLLVESHMASMYSGETDLDEWEDCFSDSIIFDLADGAGSALSWNEYAILWNTFGEFATNCSIQHGTAEYVDDHTVEITYVERISAKLGLLGGAVEYWLAAMRLEVSSEGDVEWEIERRNRFHFDGEGAIDKVTAVSPVSRRRLFGVILSLYTVTAGPLDSGLEATDSLSLFGYNAVWVLLAASFATMTMMIAVFVCICLRFCVRRGYAPAVYSEVDIVTDCESDADDLKNER